MEYQAPHDEWLEKILAKLSGELSLSDLTGLNDHLASCSRCAEAVREYELLAGHTDIISFAQQGFQLPARMLGLKEEIAQSMRGEGEKLLAVSLRLVDKNSSEETDSNHYRRRPEPNSQKAKHGGQAIREKYGPKFYSKIGKKGGQAAREKRGPQFYAEIGKKGGESTKRQRGSEFYSKIGKKGGERKRLIKSDEPPKEETE